MLAAERFDLTVPEAATAAAVVLHPHPDYGGDRLNNVVGALHEALPAAGIASIRFDFTSSDIEAGRADTTAALDLLPAGLPTFVVGYSFGAAVACGVDDERLRGWVLVAAPLGRVGGSGGDAAIGRDGRPKLVLVPVHDQYCSPSAARIETRTWTAATIEEVPSADHFLGGSAAAVARRAASWIGAKATPGRAPTAGR